LSKTEVGIGIIGLGFVGEKAHLSALRKIQGSRLAAIADVDQNRLQKVADKVKIKYAYSSHQDLINDPNVDAVVISVPTFLHKKIAIDCFKAGKHVLCEMPLAPNMKDAQEIVDQAKKADVILMPSLNFRFTPNYVKTKELIEEGSIGKPVALFYREFIPAEDLAKQWPSNSWAWNKEKSGGGPAFTLSVWAIDLLRWLLNAEVKKIYAISKDTILKELDGTNGYISLAGLEFSNNTIVTLQFSGLVRHAMSMVHLEVLGDNTNSILSEENDKLTLFGANPQKQTWIFRESGAKVWGHYQEDEHFIQSILQNKQPDITAEDALRAQEIATRIIETGNK
jgi:predicted dehydrogenase